LGKTRKVVEGGDNRKWFKTDPKPNLLTITTGPPPYISVQRYVNGRNRISPLLRDFHWLLVCQNALNFARLFSC